MLHKVLKNVKWKSHAVKKKSNCPKCHFFVRQKQIIFVSSPNFLECGQDKCKPFLYLEGVNPVRENLGDTECHLFISEPGQCLAHTGHGETHPARAANNQQRQEAALHQL